MLHVIFMSIFFLLKNGKTEFHSMNSINIREKFVQLSINPTIPFRVEDVATKSVVEYLLVSLAGFV